MPTQITNVLQDLACILGPCLGLDPLDISAQSLRVAGDMALLCANLDPIWAKRMLGYWCSDEMLTYLTIQHVPAAFHDVEAAANQEHDASGRALYNADPPSVHPWMRTTPMLSVDPQPLASYPVVSGDGPPTLGSPQVVVGG
eukprot:scaffold93170_cov32-Attheya_sp.AAC.1